MKIGELTESVAFYREIIGYTPYWVKHAYSSKRIAQLRFRAVRSIGLTPKSRYYKGWSRIFS